MERLKKSGLRKGAIIVFWLLVWQAVSMAVDNSILMVGPVPVLEALAERVLEADFWLTCFYSMLRIGLGFLGGLAVGLLLAAVSAGRPFAEELLGPLMTLLKAIPVASFVVLLLIWWGSSFLSVAVSFLIVLPNVYVNTLEGIKSTDKRLLEMADVFHMSLKNRFFYIYVPALKPFLDSCLKLSLGMSWKSGVAAEVIGIPDFSIGEQLFLSKISLDTAGILAWTGIIILLSSLCEKSAVALWNKFSKWEPEGSGIQRRRSPVRKNLNHKNLNYKNLEKFHNSRWGKNRKNRYVWDKAYVEQSRWNGEEEGGQQDQGLALVNISFAYDGKIVVDQYSSTFIKGGTYYFRTPSGSGKTTILRILAGLERPDGGRMEGTGSCSMVFQENRLCEAYSAVRNVEIVTGDRHGARKQLGELLPEDALDKPCSQLSGGMKRRCALVRAMAAHSDYVLLDEPFTGLDAENKAIAMEYIREQQRGRTLFIATHEEEEIPDSCSPEV